MDQELVLSAHHNYFNLIYAGFFARIKSQRNEHNALCDLSCNAESHKKDQ